MIMMALKVLTRKIVDGKKLSTYYVYDVNDDLLCVIPPKLVLSLGLGKDNYPIDEKTDAFKAFAYRYKYDNKRRCIYKKLPGCEPIYYIYDKMGNCIFMQDGEMRQRGEWKYTIPDKFGRMALAGTCKNQLSYDKKPLDKIAVVASYTGGDPSTFGYKVDGIELTDMMVVMANFYDDYSFVGKYNIPATLAYSPQGTSYGLRYADSKGLLTGCAKAILENSADVRYLYTATYYDYRGNAIQNVATNIFGGTDRDFYGYTYTGKVSIHTHQHSGYASVNETYTYSYDHAGRLMNTTHQVGDNGMVTLVKNTYDDLGRLSQITRHGNMDLQTTYKYNVRSWLQRISTSNLFNMSILYNESSTDRTPCYNGNISGIIWKSDSKSRGYNFKYDGFSRLLSASYRENDSKLSHYGTSYTYDDMGNILSLKRNGLQDGGTYGLIDNLTYTYQGNQVVKIDDQVEDPTYKGVFNFMDGANEEIEYEYDKNGNLVKDLNKNISKIEYNLLNLPSKITFGDGKTITYVYDASGVKLLASYKTALPASSHTIAYCGNMIYEDDAFKQVLFDGGYITFTGTRPMYHYYLKDHLGNNRVVVSSKGEVEQVTHYYPYGGIMAESTSESVQRYKYNGKELDRMHGLEWYDYGARFYDATVAMWFNVDPLAEKASSYSPYSYCVNNPIIAFDPNGMETHVVSNSNGTYTVIGGILNKDRNIYVYAQDKNGNYIKGKSIGITTSTTSFYNSEEGKWERVIIDPSDNSGREFLHKIVSSDITLDDYIDKARNDYPYDFKVTNGGKSVVSKRSSYVYRGMVIGGKNKPLFSSARDIGNMAAGIVAAKNGIPWSAARAAFDAYQSRNGLQVEGVSTRNAEYYGWSQMYRHSNGGYEATNLKASIKSLFRKIYNSIRNMF